MARKSNNTCLNVIASNNNSGLLDNMLSTSVTFLAASTGKQATGTFKIADITGTVAISIVGICSVNLAGDTSTIEVGTALSTAGLIAQTTATDIDAGDIWHDATPDSSIELTSVIKQYIVTQDIAYKIGTADITGGVITFIIRWTPISPDGNVELA